MQDGERVVDHGHDPCLLCDKQPIRLPEQLQASVTVLQGASARDERRHFVRRDAPLCDEECREKPVRVGVIARPAPVRDRPGLLRLRPEVLERHRFLSEPHAEVAPLIGPLRLELPEHFRTEPGIAVDKSKLGQAAALRIPRLGEKLPRELHVVHGRKVVRVPWHRRGNEAAECRRSGRAGGDEAPVEAVCECLPNANVVERWMLVESDVRRAERRGGDGDSLAGVADEEVRNEEKVVAPFVPRR